MSHHPGRHGKGPLPRTHIEGDTADGPNAVERRRWNDPAWTTAWLDREQITAATTVALLDHLELAAGERVLDIGCGGGGLTLAAAHTVGPNGTVVGLDLSTPLVEVARRRAEAAGLTRVSFAVGDAQLDRVPGGPFDVAASQFGVLFFDDPVAAFANVATQLERDGRLGFVCWQGIEHNPWHLGATLERFAPEGATRRPTGPFSLADPDRVLAILEAAGWVSVVCTGYERQLVVERSALIREGAAGLAGVPESARNEAQRAIASQLEPFSTPDGRYAVPLAFQVFTARRG